MHSRQRSCSLRVTLTALDGSVLERRALTLVRRPGRGNLGGTVQVIRCWKPMEVTEICQSRLSENDFGIFWPCEV